MAILLSFLGTAAALWVAQWLIDGFDFSGTWWQFLIASVIVGLANAFVKPLLRLLSLPIVVLTLGLFLLVVNALVLQFALVGHEVDHRSIREQVELRGVGV